jgi:hypothetical protein
VTPFRFAPLAVLIALAAAGCQKSEPARPVPAASEPQVGPTTLQAGPIGTLPPAVDAARLAELLPTQVGDMVRGEVVAEQDSAMGLSVSRASGVYGTGPQAVTLLVLDVGSAEGARLMGLAAPPTGRLKGMPVHRSQTATSAVVRLQTNGRYVVEASGARVATDLLDVFVQTVNLAALPGGA